MILLFQRRGAGVSGFVSRGDVVKLAVGKMGNDTISRRFRFLDYAELPSDIKDAAANQGIQPGEVRAVHCHEAPMWKEELPSTDAR
jgi:hypothetical protein